MHFIHNTIINGGTLTHIKDVINMAVLMVILFEEIGDDFDANSWSIFDSCKISKDKMVFNIE